MVEKEKAYTSETNEIMEDKAAIFTRFEELSARAGDLWDEQSADDYAKILEKLGRETLDESEARHIITIHSQVMQKMKERGILKEFSSGLAKRGRIKSLGEALGEIGKKVTKNP